jgi:hypothetical protein
MPMDDTAKKRAIEEGICLFNSGKFFEAHEALEAVWLESSGAEKTFLHGVIQIAAAFHHQQRSNLQGFRSLLEKGWKKVEPFGAARDGMDLDSLDRQLRPWRERLQRRAGGEIKPPPLPQIHFIKDS